MTPIKCKKCKKEISDSAKFCTYCGESCKKVYCRECGEELEVNDKFCKTCGCTIQQIQIQPQNSAKGEKYDIALVSLICSLFVPLAGLILGIIAVNANKGLKNEARTFGLVAITISSIEMILVLIVLLIYILMIVAAVSMY